MFDDNYAGWWQVPIPADDVPVAKWPIIACAAFVEGMEEGYGEATAEAGMGAVSLGLDPYGAMHTIAHPGSDPQYAACQRRLRDDRLLFRIEMREGSRFNPTNSPESELSSIPF